MKKILALLLLSHVLLCLVACGNNDVARTDTSNIVSQTETTNTQISNDVAHIHTYTVAIYSPSCETNGFTKYSCNCGDQYTENTAVATGHSYNDWAETLAPTETSVGKEERKCKKCDKTESRDIPKLIAGHTHSYTSSITKEVTCQSEGIKTFSCSCGAQYTETIKKKPHNYQTEVVKPTCTKQGYTTYTCSCGVSYIDNYVDSSHSFSKYVCVHCGSVDTSNAYEYLIEWVKQNGKATGAYVTYEYVVGSNSTSTKHRLMYSAEYDYLSVVTIRTTSEDEAITQLQLDSYYYGFSFLDFQLAGFLDAPNFTDNSAITYTDYSGIPDFKHDVLELAREELVQIVLSLKYILLKNNVGITVADLGFTSY